METTAVKETPHQALLEELDRLSDRVEMTTKLIRRLRDERGEAQAECESLRRERDRILEAAGTTDTAALLRQIDRIQELEEQSSELMAERDEVARRLSALIDKVDLLQSES